MRMRSLLPATAITLCLIAMPVMAAPDSPKTVPLASHRAVYDMMLDESAENKGSVEALTGRLVFEETGNACEGFSLRSRQVFNLQTEGGQHVMESIGNSYESGDGKIIRFKFESRMDGVTTEETDGEAIISDEKELQIRVTKPLQKKASWKGEILLPAALTKQLIHAARDGKAFLDAKTYDGTNGGDMVYDTFTVIGRRIEPGAGKDIEEAAKAPELANLARWPMKISYFKRDGSGGEQTPEYSIFSEVYENGVSRAVRVTYPEFTVKAVLKELKFLPVAACKQ